MSMAEASGHHKRLLIHANRKWNLYGIFDKDRDYELHHYEITNERPTEDEVKGITTLSNKFEPEQWDQVVDALKKS